jgi:hypothetical protein
MKPKTMNRQGDITDYNKYLRFLCCRITRRKEKQISKRFLQISKMSKPIEKWAKDKPPY